MDDGRASTSCPIKTDRSRSSTACIGCAARRGRLHRLGQCALRQGLGRWRTPRDRSACRAGGTVATAFCPCRGCTRWHVSGIAIRLATPSGKLVVTVTVMLDQSVTGLTRAERHAGADRPWPRRSCRKRCLIYRYYALISEALQVPAGTPDPLGGIASPGHARHVSGAAAGHVRVDSLGGAFVPLENVVAVSSDFTIELAIER